MTGIGHNNPPPDPKPFSKRRWALSVFANPDDKKPAGAVAMAFKLFMEMDADGKGAVVPDTDFVAACGVSPRACQNFKKWLRDFGYVRIVIQGARGRSNEFQALIPNPELTAMDAVIVDDEEVETSASNTGKDEECRHPIPANSNGIPAHNAELAATNAVDPEPTAPIAGKIKTSPARLHAENNINIYNNINNLTPIEPTQIQSPPEPIAAREGEILPPAIIEPKAERLVPLWPSVDVGPNEEHVGLGVVVNCETIRHPSFLISLKAIEMGLTGTKPMDVIKSISLSFAFEWATAIDAGRKVKIPENPSSYIRKCIANREVESAINDIKTSKAKRQPTWKSPGRLPLGDSDEGYFEKMARLGRAQIPGDGQHE